MQIESISGGLGFLRAVPKLEGLPPGAERTVSFSQMFLTGRSAFADKEKGAAAAPGVGGTGAAPDRKGSDETAPEAADAELAQPPAAKVSSPETIGPAPEGREIAADRADAKTVAPLPAVPEAESGGSSWPLPADRPVQPDADILADGNIAARRGGDGLSTQPPALLSGDGDAPDAQLLKLIESTPKPRGQGADMDADTRMAMSPQAFEKSKKNSESPTDSNWRKEPDQADRAFRKIDPSETGSARGSVPDMIVRAAAVETRNSSRIAPLTSGKPAPHNWPGRSVGPEPAAAQPALADRRAAGEARAFTDTAMGAERASRQMTAMPSERPSIISEPTRKDARAASGLAAQASPSRLPREPTEAKSLPEQWHQPAGRQNTHVPPAGSSRSVQDAEMPDGSPGHRNPSSQKAAVLFPAATAEPKPNPGRGATDVPDLRYGNSTQSVSPRHAAVPALTIPSSEARSSEVKLSSSMRPAVPESTGDMSNFRRVKSPMVAAIGGSALSEGASGPPSANSARDLAGLRDRPSTEMMAGAEGKTTAAGKSAEMSGAISRPPGDMPQPAAAPVKAAEANRGGGARFPANEYFFEPDHPRPKAIPRDVQTEGAQVHFRDRLSRLAAISADRPTREQPAETEPMTHEFPDPGRAGRRAGREVPTSAPVFGASGAVASLPWANSSGGAGTGDKFVARSAADPAAFPPRNGLSGPDETGEDARRPVTTGDPEVSTHRQRREPAPRGHDRMDATRPGISTGSDPLPDHVSTGLQNRGPDRGDEAEAPGDRLATDRGELSGRPLAEWIVRAGARQVAASGERPALVSPAGFALESPGVPQAESLLRQSRSQGPPTAHAAQTMAREIAQQMAPVVRAMPGEFTEITLRPEELGRVQMRMRGQEGQILLQVVTERPETHDLMRRHIDVVERAFRDLGYSEIAFEFSTSGQSKRQPWSDIPAGDPEVSPETAEAEDAAPGPETEGAAARLDIRV
ncbi:flagellar hook-length control protein FliK [Marinovum algicola]|uniref:flagellar hook-length control protein FliK n=1 Tax=Marinovum algicola TaxID=42444 RepID=UPI0024B96847|nr:flagellar hook-length control protein FliK [Marinovum algicola]